MPGKSDNRTYAVLWPQTGLWETNSDVLGDSSAFQMNIELVPGAEQAELEQDEYEAEAATNVQQTSSS